MKKLETKSTVLLKHHLKALKMPTMHEECEKIAARCAKENVDHLGFLLQLCEQELIDRERRAADRRLMAAKFPNYKTLEDFKFEAQPTINRVLVSELMRGEYIEKRESAILIGHPGTGKTHLCLALVQEWCLQGRRVYYATAADLIQQLLKAKADLTLPGIIKKLDRFEVLIIDDISYTACDKQETDVLFTLLSARYEMRSIVITSNLAFGQWNQIFKDEMTTQAAIDRLVHHAIILELNGESYRVKAAKERNKKDEKEEVTT